jgi:hypothetical protein
MGTMILEGVDVTAVSGVLGWLARRSWREYSGLVDHEVVIRRQDVDDPDRRDATTRVHRLDGDAARSERIKSARAAFFIRVVAAGVVAALLVAVARPILPAGLWLYGALAVLMSVPLLAGALTGGSRARESALTELNSTVPAPPLQPGESLPAVTVTELGQSGALSTRRYPPVGVQTGRRLKVLPLTRVPYARRTPR